MKLLRKLSLVLLTGLAFISCQKEYSEENGGAGSGEATGTLKAAGSGECLPSSVQGVFIAGTVVNTSNFINVDVDFTALGTYTITTNVVNGYSFSATGIATATGVQTVKLTANASGIPVAAGANTFTVSFGGTQCNIVVDVYPAGTGNADLTINCAGVVLGGTYTQNTPTTSANTVQVEATVITAGLYNITTNTVNGVSFSGTGFLAVGTSMVTLVANGGTPTASGVTNYTVTAGSSTCNFSIDYAVGTTPPVGGNTWTFKAGTTTFTGTCDDAQIIDLFGIQSLVITGNTASGSGTLLLTFVNPTGAIGTGSYSGTSMTSRLVQFQYSDGTNMYSGTPGVAGSNVSANITTLNTTTHVVQGTFQGTAKSGPDPATGTAISITAGAFKANLP